MRLMVTQNGFIGMTPPQTQIGDSVCYLRGCSIPVILRRYNLATTRTAIDQYYVIGGACIHIDQKSCSSSSFVEWAKDRYGDLGLGKIILT
jgi:hypothetical protein